MEKLNDCLLSEAGKTPTPTRHCSHKPQASFALSLQWTLFISNQINCSHFLFPTPSPSERSGRGDGKNRACRPLIMTCKKSVFVSVCQRIMNKEIMSVKWGCVYRPWWPLLVWKIQMNSIKPFEVFCRLHETFSFSESWRSVLDSLRFFFSELQS